METLRALTPQQLIRTERALRDPAPGSKIEAARNAGVDLTLIIEQLRLTPSERAAKLENAATALEAVRGVARRRR